MEVQILTDISTEPVTVQEAKDYLRIIGSDEDALIAELIKSARQRLEGFTNRSFGSKTLKVRWNELNGWQELPYSPIQSITSVKNDDLDTLTYESKGLEVKQIEVFSFDGVIAQYVAGFTTLPKALKEAILKEVSTAYENRENYILADSATILSNEAKALASRFSRNTLLGF